LISRRVRDWSARFAPAGADDIVGGMVVTPDGSELVVAGYSYVISTEASRFATVADGT
jgi:hypothetical protein